LLGRFPFHLVDRASPAGSVSVTRFDLIGSHRHGWMSPVGATVNLREICSLVPVVELRIPPGAPADGYTLTVGVSVDDGAVDHLEADLVFPGTVAEAVGGEFSLEGLSGCHRCSFSVLINDRRIAARRIEIRDEPIPRVADAQGRITEEACHSLVGADEVACLLAGANPVRMARNECGMARAPSASGLGYLTKTWRIHGFAENENWSDDERWMPGST
jgi:hypothetical protein